MPRDADDFEYAKWKNLAASLSFSLPEQLFSVKHGSHGPGARLGPPLIADLFFFSFFSPSNRVNSRVLEPIARLDRYENTCICPESSIARWMLLSLISKLSNPSIPSSYHLQIPFVIGRRLLPLRHCSAQGKSPTYCRVRLLPCDNKAFSSLNPEANADIPASHFTTVKQQFHSISKSLLTATDSKTPCSTKYHISTLESKNVSSASTASNRRLRYFPFQRRSQTQSHIRTYSSSGRELRHPNFEMPETIRSKTAEYRQVSLPQQPS